MKLTVIGCWGGYPKANIKQLLLTQLSKLVFQAKKYYQGKIQLANNVQVIQLG